VYIAGMTARTSLIHFSTHNHSSTTNDSITWFSTSHQIATTEYSAKMHRQLLNRAGPDALYMDKSRKRGSFVPGRPEDHANQADITTWPPEKRCKYHSSGASLSLHGKYSTDELVQRSPVSGNQRIRQPSTGQKPPQAGFNGSNWIRSVDSKRKEVASKGALRRTVRRPGLGWGTISKKMGKVLPSF